MQKRRKKDTIFGIIKLSAWLWVCRVLCFIQVYRYHDWQSVVPLVWCLHTFMWSNKPLVSTGQPTGESASAAVKVDPYPLTSSDVDPKWIRITYTFYLPVMYLCYLWYFVVNIFGLIDYAGWSQERTTSMYIYGFYRF